MATAPKFVPPLPIHIVVPPAQDIPKLEYGQEVIFESMNQNFNICFGVDPDWLSISGKAFTNKSSFSITAPNVTTSIIYNAVYAGTTCSAVMPPNTAKSIHVTSGGPVHKR
jgi:hypothetical protein